MNFSENHANPQLNWKNILVPVDFCEASRDALRLARMVAEQSGGVLTVLHIVHFPVSYPLDALLDLDDLINAANDSLEQVSREIPPGLIRQKLAKFGKQDICQEIIEMANELPADLIVAGSPEHNGLARILHGSITEKLVRIAPCPVLVAQATKASPTHFGSTAVSNPFKGTKA
jgi:nucleotide-binding universal stress UspA family protein